MRPRQVRQCVEAEPPLRASPSLSDALMQITGGVAEEMTNCQLPFMEGTGPEDLRPCTRKALDGLGLLPQLLCGTVPPPGLTPYGHGAPAGAEQRLALPVALPACCKTTLGCPP